MIESIKKLTSSVQRLNQAYERAMKAPSKREISTIEQEIAAQLRSLQYGVGVAAIDIKKNVDKHRVEVQ